MTRRDPERELEKLDEVFKALAHPSRRHVLLVLHYRGGAMTAGEIASRFKCSWPTTSRHLGVLKQAGLVSVSTSGGQRSYKLVQSRLDEVVGSWLELFRSRPS